MKVDITQHTEIRRRIYDTDTGQTSEETRTRTFTPMFETVLTSKCDSDPDVVLGPELRMQERVAKELAEKMKRSLREVEMRMFGC